jgi:hypothetical protein
MGIQGVAPGEIETLFLYFLASECGDGITTEPDFTTDQE